MKQKTIPLIKIEMTVEEMLKDIISYKEGECEVSDRAEYYLKLLYT